MIGELMLRILRDNLVAWDTRLFLRIFELNGRRFLDWLMYWLSKIADGYVYGLIGAALLLFDFPTAKRLLPISFLAFGTQAGVYYVLKKVTRRTRPFRKIAAVSSLMSPPDQFSFPSGHTAGAFVLATVLKAFYFLKS